MSFMYDGDIRRICSADQMHYWLSQFSQQDGSPKITCDEAGGLEYVVSSETCLYPKGDEDGKNAALEFVMRKLCRTIVDHRVDAGSIADDMVLFWRVRPEISVLDYERVVEYRDDGPDYDDLSAANCVMDRRWGAVKVYARFVWGMRHPKITAQDRATTMKGKMVKISRCGEAIWVRDVREVGAGVYVGVADNTLSRRNDFQAGDEVPFSANEVHVVMDYHKPKLTVV